MATSSGPMDRVVLDPLYGYISLSETESAVVDHVFVQRLRRVAQTSLASFVYPSLNGSRFEHALGSSHLARRAFDAAMRNSDKRVVEDLENSISKDLEIHGDVIAATADAVAIAALLHDLGHPPFSHALDRLAGSRDFQRIVGSDAIEQLEKEGDFPANELHEAAGIILAADVLAVVPTEIREITTAILRNDPNRGVWADCLHDLVASEIDVDRIDYLMRDNLRAGTEYGSIDYRRVLDSLEIRRRGDRFDIGFGYRARSAVEHMLLQRYQSYRWVYLHPRVVAFDLAIARALEYLIRLSESEDSVQGVEGDLTIKQLFSQNLPPMDYWTKSTTVDLRRLTNVTAAQTGEVLEVEQLAFPDVQTDAMTADALDDYRLEQKASFDDSAIVRGLQKSLLAARLITGLAENQGSNNDVERFICYANSALYRNKSAVAVWKHYEEYADVAERLHSNDGITKCFEIAGECIGRAVPEDGGLLSLLDDVRTGYEHLNPTAVLNDLLLRVCSQDAGGLTRQLDTHAYSPAAGYYGFWDGVYRGYRTAESSGGTRLYYGKGRTKELRDTSPLLLALDDARDLSIRFFLYFFVTKKSSSTSRVSADLRRDLQSTFVSRFADFVGPLLGNYFLEYAQLKGDE